MYGQGGGRRGNQQPSGLGFGPPVTPQIVKQLLIANTAIYVAQNVVPGLFAVGALTPRLFIEQGFLWQPFTYMWLHGGIWHLLMNLFVLWMFGSQLALLWGPKRFLRFYLICGVGAGFFIVAIPFVTQMVHGPGELEIPTVGASGAIYGVLLAYSLTWPNRTIMLIFPPVAFRAIWLIPALFLMSWASGAQNVSHVGHLGGVVVAWLYLRRSGDAGRLFSFEQLRFRWRRYRLRKQMRTVPDRERQPRDRNGPLH